MGLKQPPPPELLVPLVVPFAVCQILSFSDSLAKMTSNLASGNALRHPMQAVAAVAGSVGMDPRPLQKSSFFQGANNGPAEVAAMISGVVDGGKRKDDGPYFTNNEAIPYPDP